MVSSSGSIASGTPVSMISPGVVQAGGGTSIYSDIALILEKAPSDLTISPLFPNTYLVSNNQHGTNMTTFSVVVLSSDSQASVKYSVQRPLAVYSIEPLSQEFGTFVTISDDESSTYQTSTVQVGIVDPVSYVITFGPSLEYNPNVPYSFTPVIARLSDSQFALCYYSDTSAVARVGTVTSGTLNIVLSNVVAFADNSNYDVMFGVVGLSESLFLALHYNADATSTTPVNYVGPLQATVINVHSAGANTAISLGSSFTSTTAIVSGFMFGTGLSNSSAVVCFSDYNTGGGISVVALTVGKELSQSNANYSVLFGDMWEVTSGESQSLTKKGYMDLDITTISNNGQFSVLFSDLTNFGTMTLVTGQLFANGQLVTTSPNYVISGPNPNANNMYYWGALGCGTSDPNSIQMVAAYVLTDYSGDAHIHLSTFAKLPSPIGFIVANSVYFSGVISSFINLSVGTAYYTTTQGTMFSANRVYGQSSTLPYVTYRDPSSGKVVIVSLNSQVGIGVSSGSVSIKLSSV